MHVGEDASKRKRYCYYSHTVYMPDRLPRSAAMSAVEVGEVLRHGIGNHTVHTIGNHTAHCIGKACATTMLYENDTTNDTTRKTTTFRVQEKPHFHQPISAPRARHPIHSDDERSGMSRHRYHRNS